MRRCSTSIDSRHSPSEFGCIIDRWLAGKPLTQPRSPRCIAAVAACLDNFARDDQGARRGRSPQSLGLRGFIPIVMDMPDRPRIMQVLSGVQQTPVGRTSMFERGTQTFDGCLCGTPPVRRIGIFRQNCLEAREQFYSDRSRARKRRILFRALYNRQFAMLGSGQRESTLDVSEGIEHSSRNRQSPLDRLGQVVTYSPLQQSQSGPSMVVEESSSSVDLATPSPQNRTILSARALQQAHREVLTDRLGRLAQEF